MKWLRTIVRFFFLVKEIISKEGQLHFQRFRLLQTPWFAVYLHHILQSDLDKHFHDHPWSFISFILRGSYQERFTCPPSHLAMHWRKYSPGDYADHCAEDAHSITLLTPSVWTLVFVSGRERVWGYQTKEGWIDFKTYRQRKREGTLPL
jgi:hypothetical protein